jgi:hypothetical protein
MHVHAGLYTIAVYMGTAAVDLINVMIRPIVFGGVILWVVRLPPPVVISIGLLRCSV